MKAISVRQPWAWAIIHASKDVENRTWSTKYRGPLLIHAAKGLDLEALRVFKHNLNRFEHRTELENRLQYGGIIGQVDLVKVITDSTSPWAEPGMKHWIFKNAKPLPFHPCRGWPGLFDMDHPNCG